MTSEITHFSTWCPLKKDWFNISFTPAKLAGNLPISVQRMLALYLCRFLTYFLALLFNPAILLLWLLWSILLCIDQVCLLLFESESHKVVQVLFFLTLRYSLRFITLTNLGCLMLWGLWLNRFIPISAGRTLWSSYTVYSNHLSWENGGLVVLHRKRQGGRRDGWSVGNLLCFVVFMLDLYGQLCSWL